MNGRVLSLTVATKSVGFFLVSGWKPLSPIKMSNLFRHRGRGLLARVRPEPKKLLKVTTFHEVRSYSYYLQVIFGQQVYRVQRRKQPLFLF
jgi:hypothetical protein